MSSTLSLYSPVNFFVGLMTWFENRTRMSAPEAIEELDQTDRRWRQRLVASILTGLAMLWVCFFMVSRIGSSAAEASARVVTARQLAAGALALAASLLTWLLLRVVTRLARFYRHMCVLGASVRGHRA